MFDKIYLVGIDIGGTKTAVSISQRHKSEIKPINILDKTSFLTKASPDETLQLIMNACDNLIIKHKVDKVQAIGISCGSPLNSTKGLILSPPNLPKWIDFDIVSPLKKKYNTQVKLQNDANSCAIAEWKLGAGRGLDNIIFLTNGTGMGAGIILNGKLYTGKQDNAGEIGHIRLSTSGPFGYGKYGSVEGYNSGSGMAKFAQMEVIEAIESGNPPEFCKSLNEVRNITAESLGKAAQNGDVFAIKMYYKIGLRMGQTLAILIDLLNPEAIIIGGIFSRQESLLAPAIKEVISKECLIDSRSNCRILPSELGENIGDYGALSIASELVE